MFGDIGLVYVTMPLQDVPSKPAEELLRPYLDAILSLTSPPSSLPNSVDAETKTNTEGTTPSPLFTLFYIEQPPTTPLSNSISDTSSDAQTEVGNRVIYTPPSPVAHQISEIADSATTLAQDVFWKSIRVLKGLGKRPKLDEGDEGDELEGMWPPLSVDAIEDDGGAW